MQSIQTFITMLLLVSCERSTLTSAKKSSTLERLETPPNPAALIPFSRDKDFVERGTILDQIYEKFTASGSRTVLVGLGGAGYAHCKFSFITQMTDCTKANLNLLLNTRTKPEIDHRRHGFSGSMQVIPPDLSKVFERLQTA